VAKVLRKRSVNLRKKKKTGIPCMECGTPLITSDSEPYGIKTCSECKSQYRYAVDAESGMKSLTPYKNMERVNSEGLRPNHKLPKGLKFRIGDFPGCPEFLKVLMSVSAQVPKPNLGELHCSFCGNPVPRILASHGISRIRRKIDTKLDLTVDPVAIDEKVIITSDKVVACPNCVGEIKPLKDRDGNITHSNVRTFSEG